MLQMENFVNKIILFQALSLSLLHTLFVSGSRAQRLCFWPSDDRLSWVQTSPPPCCSFSVCTLVSARLPFSRHRRPLSLVLLLFTHTQLLNALLTALAECWYCLSIYLPHICNFILLSCTNHVNLWQTTKSASSATNRQHEHRQQGQNAHQYRFVSCVSLSNFICKFVARPLSGNTIDNSNLHPPETPRVPLTSVGREVLGVVSMRHGMLLGGSHSVSAGQLRPGGGGH